MNIQEIAGETYYALFAPDGNFQALTLCPDIASCQAAVHMLHKAGLSKSLHSLLLAGYQVLPLKLTLEQVQPAPAPLFD